MERARRAGEKATLLWAEGKEKEAWAVVKGAGRLIRAAGTPRCVCV